jgi:hypothetical protein
MNARPSFAMTRIVGSSWTPRRKWSSEPAVAREQGYRDGSGVGQVVRHLEQRSIDDVELRKKLARIKANLSRVLS